MLTYSTELEYIVAAAHTAGWLEAEGKICVENDDELARFLFDSYSNWKEDDNRSQDFEELIVDKLFKKYGVQ
jgi:hypothetical protein